MFLSLMFSAPAFAQVATLPFFRELARTTVDNSKGATLTITEKNRATGASVTIPAGALASASEEVVFSYSEKPPGLPEKPGIGLSFVQNSLVFAVQTGSGKILKPITLVLPYFNEQQITPAGVRVVQFNYWNVEKDTFEVIDAKPIPGKISFAKIQTDKIYPEAEYVSLRLVSSPSGGKPKVEIPPGWKLVPNADRCLKMDGPRPAGTQPSAMATPSPLPTDTTQLAALRFDASFSNACDYPIQASGCENKAGAKGCTLPTAVTMPPHSSNMLTLSGFSLKDIATVGACRIALADGTAVTYNLSLSSSAASSATICLIKKTGD